MVFKSFSRKVAFTSFFALSAFLPMSACDLGNNFTKIDRSTHSEFQDYRDAMAPREIPGESEGAEGIPDLEAYVADGHKSVKSAPLVSLSSLWTSVAPTATSTSSLVINGGLSTTIK